MRAFVTMAFGGGSNLYNNEALSNVYEKLNRDEHPTPEHLAVVGEHLIATFYELNVAKNLIEKVVDVIHSKR